MTPAAASRSRTDIKMSSGPITMSSCLSTLLRRRRRSLPILESRLSELITAGSIATRVSIVANYLPLPLPSDLPWLLAALRQARETGP